MAKFRYSVLENDLAKAAGTTSGTETIDLPQSGILSEVDIQARYKNTYVDDMLLPGYMAIKKLELLVDGSTVVKSLDGRQAQALMWYNKGPFATSNTYQGGGNAGVTYDLFPLYLGMFAGDTKNGLVLSDYSNPQLKITWDTTQTTADGMTFDANTSDPTFTYNIMAKLIDGTPAGFTNRYVQSREIDAYNPGTDSETNTEIPRGYDLKGIMLGARYKSKAWNSAMDHVKLDFDNGKWLPIDMDYENLAVAFKSWFPEPCEANAWNYRAHADDFDSRVMQLSSFTSQGAGSNAYLALWGVFEFPLYTLSIYDESHAAYTTAVNLHTKCTGWGPMQTIYIPMDQLIDGSADSIRTTDYGRIDFKVTTSGYTASATTHVVAEYLKPNGQ